jgi:methyl-accepting chemotaxis protein
VVRKWAFKSLASIASVALDTFNTDTKEIFAMSFLRGDSAARNAQAQAAAISKSQAAIEFETDGTIITANKNFLDALDYRLEEIKGKHHSMFVAPENVPACGIRAFWANLNRGEYQAGEYKRIGKGVKEVWIQASYNPILDSGGKPYKVIKFASDITAQKIRSMGDAGKIAAIGRAQAVIEFQPRWHHHHGQR